MRQPAVRALDAAYSGITAMVDDLDDDGLLLPSGCHGWSLADLMLHLTLDAQRALVAFASPTDGPPDVDAASYWRPVAGSGELAPDRAASGNSETTRAASGRIRTGS